MRNSPRRRGITDQEEEDNKFTSGQLTRMPLGELRHIADVSYGIKNTNRMSRAELVEKMSSQEDEAENKMKVEPDPETDIVMEVGRVESDQMVIQSAEGRSQVVIRGTDGSMIIKDLDSSADHTGHQFVLQTEEGEVISPEGEEVVTYRQQEEEDVEEDEEDEDTGMTNMRYKIGKGELCEDGDNSREMVIQVVPKTICHAYVIAKTVKEFRDLGRDMLRIHAENHGVEHASKLRMSELIREMIQHYNGVHNAGLEVSKLDMLKLNMLTLKKVKVDMREKTPPPDITKMIPKNVVPIEEQVHHVYEKRPDICTVDIIVNNLKDMLALGTSILRPEASKHRVCNSSRKQKLQVNNINIGSFIKGKHFSLPFWSISTRKCDNYDPFSLLPLMSN